ncbi:histone deacetylase 5 [Ricinus communis]|uniref:histone deacetylase n=1 Tax=Ricinus communis TaxID=3988 RepID=B9RLP1_RICCO|nr:histone deacetylase 5 [Ricinus communis]EEF47766.1 histone deacetylase hda1, putative [Ricinus communis]|eukprot:XP_002514660.1 histone deacetylase 5 [Ricinus communis]
MEMESSERKSNQRRVGLLYDERMRKHHTPDDDNHPENPNRISAIWNKLLANSIPQRCVVLNAKEAEDKNLLAVHSKNHVNLIRNISSKQYESQRDNIASKFNSIYFNQGSSEAAYLAAGSVVEVAERVAKGELDSAAAIVRPPGHHAEHDKAMGFCLFNNVAVAASFLLDENPELGIKKILIVDWDVHHGNGTQKTFWKDPRVLFFSVHRHEFGSFYPANDDGFYTMIGEGPGAGYNINVPWENGRCGDADYLAVWDHILIPVAKEFNPDMIIISAGFDAAVGDPLGGCRITPYGYSVMLKKLMDFANGKIVLALEGGYNLESIANSFFACMEVLLESKPIAGSSEAYPFESTWRVIQAVRKKLSGYWATLADELPLKLTSQKGPPAHLLISSSDSEDEDDRTLNNVSLNMVAVELVEPLSKLKVEEGYDQLATKSIPWRSELSKTEIWYATYGSNMWKSRFLCYIQGGQVEGMKKPCSGSMDRKPPKDILWRIFPHRLFFGRESTLTWGLGGVAFVHPASSADEKTYFCMYRITLEQFVDVLLQENVPNYNMSSPVFDSAALQSVINQGSMSLEVFKRGWYHNVVYLGQEQNIPILTMTCPPSNVESFKSGELPLCAPSKEYANTLIKGLVEGGKLSEEQAIDYIKEASIKPL